MNHVYPATDLDKLYKEYNTKRAEKLARKELVRSQFPKESYPEVSDELFNTLSKELDEIERLYDHEHYKVVMEYKELFEKYYVTMEELEIMFDLDRLYIERHILPKVRTMYLNRLIRQHIKQSHKEKKTCVLDSIMNLRKVDYEKKVFIHIDDLKKWMFEHCESDDVVITEMIINHCFQDRKNAALNSTQTTKNLYGLKHNMQLQRLNLYRVFIKAEEGKKPISRIPSHNLLIFIDSL